MVVDGFEPRAVERPRSEEELARRLAEAAGDGQAVIPTGGGRLLGMGDPPERFDLALETGGLAEITEQSTADMTVSVQAGVTLEQLNEQLGRGGQFLPLDPFAAPGHTIGGLVATALSGPLRLRYGTARDFLIGLRVALPDGKLASSGGRVVKNVSGYDLNKLHLGALGACGVVVAASFKVFPRPLHEVTLAAEGGWEEALRALRLQLPPVALEMSSSGQVHARLAGSESAVRRTAAELGWSEADPSFWAEHAARTSDAWARISVPAGALRGVLDQLPAAADWWASPGVGVAHWFDARDAETIALARRAAEQTGGSLVLLAAPPALKRQVGAWGTPPPTIEIMRRLRDAFDPGRTLSPGRYLV
ncbi:MAG TPA: FAD-binding oxidoreductase [Candidatus Dormibacteraeota bacterium]